MVPVGIESSDRKALSDFIKVAKDKLPSKTARPKYQLQEHKKGLLIA